jgi:signal peptidase I
LRDLTSITRTPGLPILSAYSEDERPRIHPQWLRLPLAGILSAAAPGLGQLYNGQFAKALCLAAIFPALFLAAGFTRVLLSFSGLIASILVTLIWRIVVVLDALIVAWREPRRIRAIPVNLNIAKISLIALLAFLPSPERFLQYFPYFRAYSVTSDSMCPTLCPDDNFVVDASFFREHAPSRGDMVVFLRAGGDIISVKRIVGLPGDLVSGFGAGEILVNEQPLHFPFLTQSCGKPSPIPDFSSEKPFDPITVPKEAFFVIGDFRTHSYDSRESSFGFVRRSELLGKPKYIYWSIDRSRIGCQLP